MSNDENSANGIDKSTQEKDDGALEGENLENFNKLTEYGISKTVAKELIKIYGTEKLSHSDLDVRALNALKEYNPNDAILVLKEFCTKNLDHVTNKSAFLCGQMKNFKARSKSGSAGQAKGPDPEKLQEILDRTGYSLDVTTGQRKYGGPPPDGDQQAPGSGHEVFCGKIPREVFEDELIPKFEDCGKIWDLRLMMDPATGLNRGYCFVTFCEKEGASEAVKKLDGYEIRKAKKLKINISIANLRLFVGNIPKNKTKDEIKEEFGKRTEGLIEVIIYGSADNPKLKNRGFAFLEFDNHKNASAAKRKLSTGRVKVWQCDIIVDWADPQEEPDEDTMSKVKVLYVRNLTSDVTEDQLKEQFVTFGKVERVKKIKDYGFVHFEERDDAITAMETLNGEKIGGLAVDISLAKPPTENKKKEQRKQRDQERRTLLRDGYGGWDDYYPPPRPPMPPHSGMRRLPPPPLDPYYDDYFYEEDYYYGGYAPLPPPPPPMPRSRGLNGPYSPPPMRVSRAGGPPPRGPPVHGGAGTRGAGARGRLPRPSAGSLRGGRGGPPYKGQPVQPRGGGKRKAGTDFSQSVTKRRNTQDNWGNRPIAQQPLDQTGYGSGGYDDYSGNDAQWYQDSFGQNWG